MHQQQDKDISIIWTSLLMKSVGLWLAADQNEQRRRDFALVYTAGALFTIVCIGCRDIYFTWGNFVDSVYISCNNLYLMIVVLKVSVLYAHRTEFYKLIKFTQKNFWCPSCDPHEQLIVEKCKRLCIILIIIINICVQGTCTGYMVTPILENMGKNESDRILPFNLWVDLPVSLSPYFEVIFIIQILCVYHVGVCYICFDNLLCILNLHVASQFRILQHRLRYLDDAVKDQMIDRKDAKLSGYAIECNMKLKGCVRHHQTLTNYCKNLDNIFTMMVLGQILFFAAVICLVGFQLFLVDTHPSRKFSLVLNFVGTLCQLLMFTYSCDDLIQQSLDVGDAIFAGPWANLPMDKVGIEVRKNLIFIIVRANRVCFLTAGGFFPVSLETCTAALSTAMSYFTLLKQSSVKIESD
ncbi:PREDICTED: odorant receptor 30a-like [Eufriesea mexicana]|uniref:odorant receptor 30a-like n=1 Tax=Eufriesea mexicana TaxID=516756 RepID=UPI00083C20FA|nr:PREDICTED: odorant receptor 30a-like [Eufriesea mexicana]